MAHVPLDLTPLPPMRSGPSGVRSGVDGVQPGTVPNPVKGETQGGREPPLHTPSANTHGARMKGNGSLLIAMALGFLALVVIARLLPRRGGSNEVPRAAWPLTRNEQAMYFRLQGALPDLIVLSQVSFGALLSARSAAVRNTFDRKRADFVICEKSFKVVAIVELDDSSHDGKKARDEKRDALLQAAGYRVLRYRGIPNIDRVQSDFAPPPPPPTPDQEGRVRLDPTWSLEAKVPANSASELA